MRLWVSTHGEILAINSIVEMKWVRMNGCICDTKRI